MRKIFIDLGGHVGESVRYFRKHHDPNNEFEIFSFEPLPENIDKLDKIDGVRVMPYACSTYDGYANFYTGLPESGSLSSNKRTGNLDGKTCIKVKVINFPRWFADLLRDSEQNYVPKIIIKMNIEGAEYDIIRRMDKWGQIPFVSKWYVNWHWDKIGMSREAHDEVRNIVPKSMQWKAMFEK